MLLPRQPYPRLGCAEFSSPDGFPIHPMPRATPPYCRVSAPVAVHAGRGGKMYERRGPDSADWSPRQRRPRRRVYRLAGRRSAGRLRARRACRRAYPAPAATDYRAAAAVISFWRRWFSAHHSIPFII
ncbi:hypothetical protein KCP71_16060 [Salmonella enterica subsp. enterica]|nr:hypothetical protein KCP71_16060 [Salmonella enterica subsp. enterica]